MEIGLNVRNKIKQFISKKFVNYDNFNFFSTYNISVNKLFANTSFFYCVMISPSLITISNKAEIDGRLKYFDEERRQATVLYF